MSLCFELPRELIHAIGARLTDPSNHSTLALFARTCIGIHYGLSFRLKEAKEVHFVSLWKADWKRALKDAPNNYLAILACYDVQIPNVGRLVDKCIKCASLQTLQNTLNALKWGEDEVKDADLLYKVCRKNLLSQAQWLVEHFGLTIQHVRDQYIFQFVCADGHLEMAQWLTKHFGLSNDDVQKDDSAALEFSSTFGHEHVVHWLRQDFS